MTFAFELLGKVEKNLTGLSLENRDKAGNR
jgi:hypothetical protein